MGADGAGRLGRTLVRQRTGVGLLDVEDVDRLRALVAEADGDVSVGGPTLAGAALRAGPVAAVGDDEATVRVETGYPWDGQVRVRVDASPGAWGLTVRVPHWAASASATVNGEALQAEPAEGWLTVTRAWAEGDELV